MTRDPEHVLVIECHREVKTGCLTRLNEVGVLKRGKVRQVVDGPVPNARFMVDRTGRPVFSWAQSEDEATTCATASCGANARLVPTSSSASTWPPGRPAWWPGIR